MYFTFLSIHDWLFWLNIECIASFSRLYSSSYTVLSNMEHVHYFKIFFLTFSAENLNFKKLAPWENSRIHAKKCPTERKSVLPSANLINRIFRKLYLEYRTLSHSRDTLHLEYPTEKTKLGIIFTDKSHRDTVMDFLFNLQRFFNTNLWFLCPKPGIHGPDQSGYLFWKIKYRLDGVFV